MVFVKKARWSGVDLCRTESLGSRLVIAAVIDIAIQTGLDTMRNYLLIALPSLSMVACASDSGEGGKVSDIVITVEDEDGDGYSGDEDCNDEDASVSPDAVEICDGIDNNCDGAIDEGTTDTYWPDADADGYGDMDGASEEGCAPPEGFVPNSDDCDDGDVEINPAASEVCDGADNDCDGLTDTDDDSCDLSTGSTYYEDSDGDGFGLDDSTMDACGPPSGYVEVGGDCDDDEITSYPGAEDTWYDGIDSDCAGDSDYDADVDGYDSDAYGGDDCDDAEATTYPGAADTWYDGVDSDCAGDSDYDADSDGYDAFSYGGDDCDDTVDIIYPGAPDTWYDGVDSDCAGDSDYDADVDGYDSDAHGGDDCDDAVFTTNPGATETWYDGVDADCAGDSDYDADADTFDSDAYGGTDCDDALASTYPGAPDTWYDGVDADCAGDSDYDSDADGYDSDLYGGLDCDDVDATEPLVVSITSGSSTGDGSSTAPYDTIQAGIDAASLCVAVEAGTYAESLDFNGSDIAVRSVDGAETTIIDASSLSAPGVTFANSETAAAELRGFTITAGSGNLEESSISSACTSISTCVDYYSNYCGGGIYVNGADPTLADLTLDLNDLPERSATAAGLDTYYVESYGGGACFMGSNATLENTIINDNFADQGGGLFVDETSSIAVSQTVVTGNEAADGAGFYVDGGTLALTNVLTVGNIASNDGGAVLAAGGALTITNTTMAADSSATGVVTLTGTNITTLINSIVSDAPAGYGVYGDSTVIVTATYNNVYNNASGDYGGSVASVTGTLGNIAVDPLYTDVSLSDYTLQATSPSVDAGDPTASYNDSDGSVNDQGAYGGPNDTW
jgi:hypothetical protein